MNRTLLLSVLLLLACSDKRGTQTSSCPGAEVGGVVGERARAMCLAQPLPAVPLSSGHPHDVVLYLDRSASMQGFLDPDYPTQVKTDFRSVLDVVIAGLKPTRMYSYGASISEASPTIGVLGDKAFYKDRDTRMEEVISLIANDSLENNVHMIIGDGRRGSPTTADGQYVRLREVAAKWIATKKGSFIVASSNAPFKTVESDPSGCRKGVGMESGHQTCPIYLFAFVPAGDEMRIARQVAGAFEHLFIWPAPAMPAAGVTLQTIDNPALLNVNPIWEHAKSGAPIIRSGSPAPQTKFGHFRLALSDTISADGHALKLILSGNAANTVLESRLLTADTTAAWSPMGPNSIVRTSSTTPLGLEITSRGPSAFSTIVRASVIPTGEPAWLDQVNAQDAHDVVRTYGIGRLFESFRQQAKQKPINAIVQTFLVVN